MNFQKIILISIILMVCLIICFFCLNMKYKWLSLKKIQLFFLGKDRRKMLAWSIILFLMISDFCAIFLLFNNPQFQSKLYESIMFGITFAICLEGFPTLLGVSLNSLISKVKSKENDSKHAWIATVVGIIGSCVVIFLSCYLRYLVIEFRGGKEAFMDGILKSASILNNYEYCETPGAYMIDNFLMISPILTSLLAFFISWVWLRTDYKDNEKNKIDSLYHRFVYQTYLYESSLHKFQNARVKLWTLVCSDKEMPIRPEVYQREIFNRIREKLFHSCLDALDTEMEIYNSEIEILLQSYITELSKYSILSDEIQSMKLAEVIKHHDNGIKDINKWNYDDASPIIHKNLYDSLNRAFKSHEREKMELKEESKRKEINI